MAAQVTPAEAEERLAHARNKLAEMISRADLTGKALLDVGCGIGNCVLAAIEAGAALAVGIDINLREFGYNYFPELAAKYEIDLNRGVLVEGDFSQVRIACPAFHFITCLDVIEHIAEPGVVLKQIYDHLAPGGLAIVDTAPLFYSQVGHHLFSYFGREEMPWAHLRPDFESLLIERKVGQWSIDRYRELNKITYGEIKTLIASCGFTVVKEQTGLAGKTELATFRAALDLSAIESEEDLFIEWVHFILRK